MAAEAGLADLDLYAKRTAAIMDDLLQRYPGLNPITAHVMAADLYSVERVYPEVVAGTLPVERAVWHVGSFARWDFALRLVREGLLSQERFDRDITSLWSSSDPDDTEPEYLKVWLDARARHGKRIEDRRHLRAGEFITVYRGGPQDASLLGGFAWTLSRGVAQMFANGAGTRTLRNDGIVVTGKVRRGQVIAFISGRNEDEVIVSPQVISNVKVVRDGGRKRPHAD